MAAQDTACSEMRSEMKINKQQLADQLPPEWVQDLLPEIQKAVAESGQKIVVLDDDPTGTQTVHDVTILTGWSRADLVSVLEEPDPVVYILTNSRSLPLQQAQELNREITNNLKHASEKTGREFSIVSRSDSTLRGHFPGEVQVLLDELGYRVDGILVIPFFEEGGRFTIHDIHYVLEGEMLTPAGETEFARDATFGYQHSDLREWVSEKYSGQVAPEDVASIDLMTIRDGGPEAVAQKLKGLQDQQVCVVNSACYRDMEVFVSGLLQAEAAGKRFVYRTAASFVRVRGGISPRDLVSVEELGLSSKDGGGLIIAGSYIKKSTQQIEALKAMPQITILEADVAKLLEPGSRQEEIRRVDLEAERALANSKDVLIYTSRNLIKGDSAESSLEISRSVSQALVEIVHGLERKPAWVIAKGGITSSDIATQGLMAKRATVLGQVLPGVPVWRMGTESHWPDLVYVVFPGNVGGPNAIAEVVSRFQNC